jgi:4-nitrophenyl phosphatase
MPGGVIPGGGSLLAAVAYASGVTPVVAGKPYQPMVDLVQALVGPEGVFVGDRPDTDGRFALALGYRFGLVLSGVTTAGDLPVQPPPDVVAADLAELVSVMLG